MGYRERKRPAVCFTCCMCTPQMGGQLVCMDKDRVVKWWGECEKWFPFGEHPETQQELDNYFTQQVKEF